MSEFSGGLLASKIVYLSALPRRPVVPADGYLLHFGDGTVGGREIPATPKVSPAVALLDLRELALNFLARAALHQPHQVADG